MRERIPDPIEEIVRQGLDNAGVQYSREGDANHPSDGLDFYLPFFGVHIECKWGHTERISEQMSRHKNVIAIQGQESADFFRLFLLRAGFAIKDKPEPSND